MPTRVDKRFTIYNLRSLDVRGHYSAVQVN